MRTQLAESCYAQCTARSILSNRNVVHRRCNYHAQDPCIRRRKPSSLGRGPVRTRFITHQLAVEAFLILEIRTSSSSSGTLSSSSITQPFSLLMILFRQASPQHSSKKAAACASCTGIPRPVSMAPVKAKTRRHTQSRTFTGCGTCRSE